MTAEPPGDGYRAEETADRILRGFGLTADLAAVGARGQYEYRSVESGYFLADVEADAQSFASQLPIAARGDGVPCIVREEWQSPPVPIDLWDYTRGHPDIPTFAPRGGFPLLRWELNQIYEYFARGGERRLQVIAVPPPEAATLFRQHVIEFLKARFSAHPPLASPSPGVQFTVATKGSGERVHYSPAYFQKISTVFGSPTTPVSGWIQPGRYTFSVVGANGTMRFDPGQYSVPPSTSAQLIV